MTVRLRCCCFAAQGIWQVCGARSQVASRPVKKPGKPRSAIHEAREETGIELSEIWSTDILEQFYEVDKECITLVPVFVSTVPTDTTVSLNDEHDAYEWVSLEKANTMLSFPGQQKALAAVKAEFVDKTPNPHLKIELNG